MDTQYGIDELYIDLLLEYCNTYDSEAISQVLLASQAQTIKMTGDGTSDAGMYTELVDIEEDDRKHRDGGSGSFLYDTNAKHDDAVNHDRSVSGQDDFFGEVILSEPGGGKTTYLKHKVINICEEYAESGYDGLFPIFIVTRELDRADISDPDTNNLKKIIISAFDFIFRKSDDYNPEYAEYLYDFIVENGIPVILVIDGFEELTRDEYIEKAEGQSQDDGLEFLERLRMTLEEQELYTVGLTISSRYKEYGYQKLKAFVNEYELKERIIPSLSDNEDKIFEFVRNWLNVFKKINPSFDPEKESEKFKKLYEENQSIKNIISTPIELTSLIMIFITSYTLPTDVSILYRSVMEVWLTFNVKTSDFTEFSLEDILMELSRVAMYMACTDDEKICISEDNLKMVIENTRENFIRYYKNHTYMDEDVNKKISYIVRRNIMEKNGNVYQFKHRQYQAYLCALGIVRNNIARKNDIIFKENRQGDRMVYFEKHLDACDDFWDQILIFSAFMDMTLHDSIIAELIDRTEEDEDNNYYLGIIIRLMNSQGFWMEDEELEIIFTQLLRCPSRWAFTQSGDNEAEIKQLLSSGRRDEDGRRYINTIFLKSAIDRYKEIPEDNASEELLFRRSFTDILFYLLWKCDYDESYTDEALSLFFENFLSVDALSEIVSLPQDVDNALCRRIDAILDDEELLLKHTDLPIIAAILVHRKGKHPIETALDYYKMGKKYHSISNDIISAMIWLHGVGWELDFGYDISSEEDEKRKDELYYTFVECKKYICEGLLEKDKNIRRTYERAFVELPALEADISYYRDEASELLSLYREDVYDYYVSLCREVDSVYRPEDPNERSVRIEYAVLASYPYKEGNLRMSERLRTALNEEKISQIKNVYENAGALIQTLYAFKLLLCCGEFDSTDKILRAYSKLYSKHRSRIESGSYKLYCSHIIGPYDYKQFRYVDEFLCNAIGVFDDDEDEET